MIFKIPFFTLTVAFSPINSLLTPKGKLGVSVSSSNEYNKPVSVTPSALSEFAKTEIIPLQSLSNDIEELIITVTCVLPSIKTALPPLFATYCAVCILAIV